MQTANKHTEILYPVLRQFMSGQVRLYYAKECFFMLLSCFGGLVESPDDTLQIFPCYRGLVYRCIDFMLQQVCQCF